jgi:hypothetical protein
VGTIIDISISAKWILVISSQYEDGNISVSAKMAVNAWMPLCSSYELETETSPVPWLGYDRSRSIRSRNQNFSIAILILMTGTGISICSPGSGPTGTRILHLSSGSGLPEILYKTGISLKIETTN